MFPRSSFWEKRSSWFAGHGKPPHEKNLNGTGRRGGTFLSVIPIWAKLTQNSRAGVTQILVFGSIYKGAILVHLFEPHPHSTSPRLLTTSMFHVEVHPETKRAVRGATSQLVNARPSQSQRLLRLTGVVFEFHSHPTIASCTAF